ncbi:MAG TPA: DNA-binding transcriptional regulator Fis [Burkholderiales bacterium]|jgi:Fis family transcriptional regulator|nr:DNA-binding transcriptional regulator Fis [Burkholderiales bacterium]
MSKERRGPVAACVKQTMERYFSELNGEKVTGVYDMVLHEMEKPLLEIVMRHTKGNQVRAADILGINRNTLRKKLKQHKVHA